MRDLGDTIAATFTVVDPITGAPADAATGTPVLLVTRPDGTTANPAVAHSSGPSVAGVYVSTFVATQAGRHRLSWSSTGSNATSAQDVLDVAPSDPALAISLDVIYDQLRISAERNPALDARLRDYAAAATNMIEAECGPILSRTRTYTTNGGSRAIMLPHAPTSVASISVNGATLGAGAYTADLASGIVYSGTRDSLGSFGLGPVVVTYATGSTVVDANVQLAAAIIIRQLWQLDQQGYRPAYGQPDQDRAKQPLGFALPRAAVDLLRGTNNALPGFA